MEFPASSLIPRGGEMYSHVFENPRMGIERDHFWSITIHFEPIEHAGNAWNCSMTTEWLRFGIRNWRELDGYELQPGINDAGVESSFYMTCHDLGRCTQLKLSYLQGNRFRVKMDLIVDFHGYAGGDEDPAMAVSADAEIEYTGLIVVPDNLFPNPQDAQDVCRVAAPFVDLTTYEAPERDDFRFVLRPRSS